VRVLSLAQCCVVCVGAPKSRLSKSLHHRLCYCAFALCWGPPGATAHLPAQIEHPTLGRSADLFMPCSSSGCEATSAGAVGGAPARAEADGCVAASMRSASLRSGVRALRHTAETALPLTLITLVTLPYNP